jgi:hypothetical protein
LSQRPPLTFLAKGLMKLLKSPPSRSAICCLLGAGRIGMPIIRITIVQEQIEL